MLTVLSSDRYIRHLHLSHRELDRYLDCACRKELHISPTFGEVYSYNQISRVTDWQQIDIHSGSSNSRKRNQQSGYFQIPKSRIDPSKLYIHEGKNFILISATLKIVYSFVLC